MTCHNAIYLEFGFNLTYMLQSKDRINRVGLPENTETNYYFAMSGGLNPFYNIDQKIYDRLKLKEDRMRQAIESNNIIFVEQTSDIEDIQFILGQ